MSLWVQHIQLLSLGKCFSSYSKLHMKLHLLMCVYVYTFPFNSNSSKGVITHFTSLE